MLLAMMKRLDRASVLLLIALATSAAAEQTAYNFACDLSPQQHDGILQEAISNLQKGEEIFK